MGLELDKWIEKLRRTEYLAEDELKALCDYVGCGSWAPGCSIFSKHKGQSGFWAVRLSRWRCRACRSRRFWWRSPTCSR